MAVPLKSNLNLPNQMKAKLLIALGALGLAVTPGVAQETPLRSGDTVEIRITGVPPEEMSIVNARYTIHDGGAVRLPHLGAVTASGLKPSELGRRIESAYKSGEIYTRPIINVTPDASDVQRVVYVGGEVKSGGGRIPFVDGMTLYEVIIASSGYSEFAKKEAALTRDGRTSIFKMKSIEKGDAPDPRLQPGDRVIVR